MDSSKAESSSINEARERWVESRLVAGTLGLYTLTWTVLRRAERAPRASLVLRCSKKTGLALGAASSASTR